MKSEFEEKLYKKALEAKFELSDEVLNKLSVYKNKLVEWNQKMNLTAITDDEGIIEKHFIDSLECCKYIKKGQSIADVGTGAGFPGLVIAIYMPDVNITLIDALNKRINFLNDVVDTLKLKNVKSIHSRAEDLAIDIAYRQKYDIVVARAVASTNILLEYTTPYAKINGKCLLMKSNNIDEEIEKAINALKRLNCKISNIYQYQLNSTEIYQRSIIEVTKIADTPKNYPRSFAKIKKMSL